MCNGFIVGISYILTVYLEIPHCQFFSLKFQKITEFEDPDWQHFFRRTSRNSTMLVGNPDCLLFSTSFCAKFPIVGCFIVKIQRYFVGNSRLSIVFSFKSQLWTVFPLKLNGLLLEAPEIQPVFVGNTRKSAGNSQFSFLKFQKLLRFFPFRKLKWFILQIPDYQKYFPWNSRNASEFCKNIPIVNCFFPSKTPKSTNCPRNFTEYFTVSIPIVKCFTGKLDLPTTIEWLKADGNYQKPAKFLPGG